MIKDFWIKSADIVTRYGGMLCLGGGIYTVEKGKEKDSLVCVVLDINLYMFCDHTKDAIDLSIIDQTPFIPEEVFLKDTFSHNATIILDHIILTDSKDKSYYTDKISMLYDMMSELRAYWETVPIKDVPLLPATPESEGRKDIKRLCEEAL